MFFNTILYFPPLSTSSPSSSPSSPTHLTHGGVVSLVRIELVLHQLSQGGVVFILPTKRRTGPEPGRGRARDRREDKTGGGERGKERGREQDGERQRGETNGNKREGRGGREKKSVMHSLLNP